MNNINTAISNFHTFFLNMDFVDNNGGLCLLHPDNDDIGIGQGSCTGNTYGYDQRTKSTAFFSVTVTPEQINRLTVRNRIVFTCRLFYDCKKYGHLSDNYDMALRFQQYLKAKYRISPTFAVSGDYPQKAVTVVINVDVFGSCDVTVDENAAIC